MNTGLMVHVVICRNVMEIRISCITPGERGKCGKTEENYFSSKTALRAGTNTSRETRNCTRISSYFMALSTFGSMARISAITRSIVRGGRPFRLPPALLIGMAGT
jgi:hypothetical protein